MRSLTFFVWWVSSLAVGGFLLEITGLYRYGLADIILIVLALIARFIAQARMGQ